MQSKGLRSRSQRQVLDIIDVVRKFNSRWDVVDVAGTKIVILAEHLRRDIDSHNGLDQPNILVISNPTAVIDLSPEVIEHLIRYDLILIQQHPELFLADPQIFIGELICDVPAYWSELAAVLDDGVEETETEE